VSWKWKWSSLDSGEIEDELLATDSEFELSILVSETALELVAEDEEDVGELFEVEGRNT